jgi:hypothetical protein
LHFIAELFRAYQEDESLMGPPFTAGVASIVPGS